ncbi:hypothetical protein, partial [Pseudomonas gessardii]|uniref:hypothetical protein n=1 Tax=Pseudomonas gessardii TaxID=78544 RepID=UPI001CA401E9
QAEALSLTELNDGALFDAEFGIGHRGSTVPERSGVALSFRGRQLYLQHRKVPRHFQRYSGQITQKLSEQSGLNLVQHNYFYYGLPSRGNSQASDLQ